jgi:hypothetical protein
MGQWWRLDVKEWVGADKARDMTNERARVWQIGWRALKGNTTEKTKKISEESASGAKREGQS